MWRIRLPLFVLQAVITIMDVAIQCSECHISLNLFSDFDESQVNFNDGDTESDVNVWDGGACISASLRAPVLALALLGSGVWTEPPLMQNLQWSKLD